MIVALIGATGNAGSRILAELIRRGHEVRALVRHPEKVPIRAGVTAHQVDANDLPALSRCVAGAVVSSVKFKDTDTGVLIEAVRRAGLRRYLVVGGAGSLEIAPGLREVDGPGFPPHVRPEALKGAAFLEQLRASDLDWTFLSPSRMVDASGRSSISYEDYAVALVDELERPKHLCRRFTVGY